MTHHGAEVAPRRLANRQPLANVIFEYQRFGALTARAGLPLLPKAGDGTDAELDALVESTTAKHDLILFFVDDGRCAELALEYDTDILDAETAARWLGFFSHMAAFAVTPVSHG